MSGAAPNLTIRSPNAVPNNKGVVGKAANAVKGAAAGAAALVGNLGSKVVEFANPTSVTSINPGCVGTVCEVATGCANGVCSIQGGKRRRKTRGNKRRTTKKRRTVRRR